MIFNFFFRTTEDFEFEDPLEKLIGHEEFSLFCKLFKYMDNSVADFVIHGEHHGPHEIVMDWTAKFQIKALSFFPMEVRMRSHILLEPAASPSGKEKIFRYGNIITIRLHNSLYNIQVIIILYNLYFFRIYEEWNGNKLLTEKTTFPSFIGKIHSMLRRSTGNMWVMLMRTGWF